MTITGTITVTLTTPSIIKSAAHIITDPIKSIKNEWDRLEESVSDELGRIEHDLRDTFDTITGEKGRDQEELAKQQAELSSQQAAIAAFAEDLATDAMLFGEIFAIGADNKLDARMIPFLKLVADYERAVAEFGDKYHFTSSLAEHGYVGKLVSSIVHVIGAVGGTVHNIMTGNANSSDYAVIGTIIIAIVLILSEVGATAGWAMLVGLYVQLDMQTGGAGLAIGMRVIDFAVQDVLHMDDWAGSDWGNFDNNSEYYEETKQLLGTTIMIAAAIYAAGQMSNIDMTAVLGEQGAVYAGYYAKANLAMSAAQLAGDLYKYHDEKTKLDEKAEADTQRIIQRVYGNMNYKMMLTYKDIEEMQRGSEIMLAEYIGSISESHTEVMDPSAMVAMSGFDFEKHEDAVYYGFEELFDYDGMAGSDTYSDDVIYRWGHEKARP